MFRAPRHRFLIITLVWCCFSFSLAQDGPRQERPGAASAADEAALRALAQEFYAAYAEKDLDGFLRLWSAKAPELGARQQAMQKLFADHEKTELKILTVRNVMVDGDKAKLRVDVEMSAVETKTDKLAAGLGRRNRSLHCIKDDGVWKVWQEISAAESLAEQLAVCRRTKSPRCK